MVFRESENIEIVFDRDNRIGRNVILVGRMVKDGLDEPARYTYWMIRVVVQFPAY